MKFCSKCGKELVDEAVICPGCGCAVGEVPGVANPTTNASDEVSIGLCVVSALIPLFGIIYWAAQAKTTPKKAKACGITALVSWGVGLIFSMISSIMFGSMYFDFLSDLMYYYS